MDSLRLSDADRESAMELLSEHYAIGRLTKDEFDERSDAVWSAKTQGDAEGRRSNPRASADGRGRPTGPRRSARTAGA